MTRYLLPLVLLTLAACGGEETPKPADEPSLVGTCTLQTQRVQTTYLTSPGTDLTHTFTNSTMTFGADGSLTQTENGAPVGGSCTYTLSGTTLTTLSPGSQFFPHQIRELTATRLVLVQTGGNNWVRTVITTTATR